MTLIGFLDFCKQLDPSLSQTKNLVHSCQRAKWGISDQTGKEGKNQEDFLGSEMDNMQ